MPVVISDTGPIYYLVLIDCAEILPALFGRVILPSVVMAELTHAETPAKVRAWMAQAPRWLEVRGISSGPLREEPPIEKLDAGELAVIELAMSTDANLLLIDDRKGVRFARRKGFAVTGTLGVLARAAERHGLDLREALARLSRTNFYCSREIIEELLARSSKK